MRSIFLVFSLLLQAELAGLFGLLILFAQYVLFPCALVVIFFRSTKVPRALKIVTVGIAGILALLVTAEVYLNTTASQYTQAQPVLLTVRQPSLLPYYLGSGKIEQARYDSARLLVVSGILPDGSTLRAYFDTSTKFARRNETDEVVVTVNDGEDVAATGWSTFQPHQQTVTGNFHCVLPTGKQLTCSFPPTPVIVRKITNSP